jgi:hypothetical protein
MRGNLVFLPLAGKGAFHTIGRMSSTLPQTLGVALKEWATVCQALASGRQTLLLRKGGIYESAGEFEVERPQWVFFPTYVHQSLAQLKPDAHAGFRPHTAEPDRVTLSVVGAVADVHPVKCREQLDELDDLHVWTRPLLDMRFNYRPENPLYLLVVRAYRLAEPVTIDNTPTYAGCKSWVPLEAPVDLSGAQPALDDTTFQTRRQLIRARLEGVSTGFG